MILNEIILAKPIIEEVSREKLPNGVLCRVSYPICNVGKKNANGRVYEDAVYDKVMAEKELQEKLENRCLFGHAEHPEQTQSNLEKTSHVIIEMWKDNGQVWQKFDILDTPMGRIVDCLLKAECQVGCSTRAEGDLEEAEDDEGSYQRVIPESYNYVTTDFTADPSTFGVIPHDIKRNIVSEVRKLLENKEAEGSEKEFAICMLESMKCKDKSKCQNCGCCEVLKTKKGRDNNPKSEEEADISRMKKVKFSEVEKEFYTSKGDHAWKWSNTTYALTKDGVYRRARKIRPETMVYVPLPLEKHMVDKVEDIVNSIEDWREQPSPGSYETFNLTDEERRDWIRDITPRIQKLFKEYSKEEVVKQFQDAMRSGVELWDDENKDITALSKVLGTSWTCIEDLYENFDEAKEILQGIVEQKVMENLIKDGTIKIGTEVKYGDVLAKITKIEEGKVSIEIPGMDSSGGKQVEIDGAAAITVEVDGRISIQPMLDTPVSVPDEVVPEQAPEEESPCPDEGEPESADEIPEAKEESPVKIGDNVVVNAGKHKDAKGVVTGFAKNANAYNVEFADGTKATIFPADIVKESIEVGSIVRVEEKEKLLSGEEKVYYIEGKVTKVEEGFINITLEDGTEVNIENSTSVSIITSLKEVPVPAPEAESELPPEEEVEDTEAAGPLPVEKDIPESKVEESDIPTESGISDKIAPHNLLQDKDGQDWIVKEVVDTGLTVTQPGEMGTEKFVSWEDVGALGFTKVSETKVNEATVVQKDDGWYVESPSGALLGGPYTSKVLADKRRKDVEFYSASKESKIKEAVLPDEKEVVKFVADFMTQEKVRAMDSVEKTSRLLATIINAFGLTLGDMDRLMPTLKTALDVWTSTSESKLSETAGIKAMYKAAKLPAPDGKGIHTKAFHELVVNVAKGYVKGGDTPKEALDKAYPTAMKQLGKEKAVKKPHQKESKVDEGFKTDVKNKDEKAIKAKTSDIIDKLLAGKTLSRAEKHYWSDYGTAVGGKKNTKESIDETVLVVDDPDPKLVELLKSGADGGKGEFEEFLPSELKKEVEARDATYVPSLTREDKVVWSEVSLSSPKESKVDENISDKQAGGVLDVLMSQPFEDFYKGKLEDYLTSGEEEEKKEVIAAIKSLFSRVKESISTTAKEITNLRVQEASTRAERDKAIELLEEITDDTQQLKEKVKKDKAFEIKILVNKIGKAMEAKEQEVDALRAKLEEKVKLAADVKGQLEEKVKLAVDVEKQLEEKSKLAVKVKEQMNETAIRTSKYSTGLNKELTAAKTEHQKDLSEVEKKYQKKLSEAVKLSEKKVKEAKEETEERITEEVTKKFVKRFIEFKLSETGLKIDENSRALLENCKSLEAVEDTLDEIMDAKRRGALHSNSISSIHIVKREVKDPEVVEAEHRINNCFEGMGFVKKGK